MISAKIKWDASKLYKAVDGAEKRYLFKAGGTLRTIARRSIKRRKKKSRPGQPPSSQTGVLKNSIMFAVDLIEMDATIGPTFIAMHEIAELHEFGGIRNGIEYPARPYMAPALEEIIPQLPVLWANSIK